MSIDLLRLGLALAFVSGISACQAESAELPDVDLRPERSVAAAWTTDSATLALRDSLRARGGVPAPIPPAGMDRVPERGCELMPNAWSDLPLCRGR